MLNPDPRSKALVAHIGWAGAALFLVLALRAAVMQTSVDFSRGELRVRTRLAPWTDLTLPIANVAELLPAPQPDGTTEVHVRLHSGAAVVMPVDLEPIPKRLTMFGRRLGAAPPEHARFVAERLNAMLETARREGHDTYRT